MLYTTCMENTYFNPKDISQKLNVSIYLVYRLIKGKKITAYKIGKEWRISTDALNEFLEKNSNLVVS